MWARTVPVGLLAAACISYAWPPKRPGVSARHAVELKLAATAAAYMHRNARALLDGAAGDEVVTLTDGRTLTRRQMERVVQDQLARIRRFYSVRYTVVTASYSGGSIIATIREKMRFLWKAGGSTSEVIARDALERTIFVKAGAEWKTRSIKVLSDKRWVNGRPA